MSQHVHINEVHFSFIRIEYKNSLKGKQENLSNFKTVSYNRKTNLQKNFKANNFYKIYITHKTCIKCILCLF